MAKTVTKDFFDLDSDRASIIRAFTLYETIKEIYFGDGTKSVILNALKDRFTDQKEFAFALYATGEFHALLEHNFELAAEIGRSAVRWLQHHLEYEAEMKSFIKAVRSTPPESLDKIIRILQ
jgi:hypothetical protein